MDKTLRLKKPKQKNQDIPDEDPHAKKKRERRERRNRILRGGSSSSESEEDFAFLETQLREDTHLDDMTTRMLQGIVQPPPRDYKRHDKMSKKEFWEQRKLKALQRGINLDSTDDEDLETVANDTRRRNRRVRV